MVNGAPTGPDSGFDIHEPAYLADAHALRPTPRMAAQTVPTSHNVKPISPSANLYPIPVVVPSVTLSGLPIPIGVVPKTPDSIVTNTAGAATDTLAITSTITQNDIDALGVGDTVVSNGGTTREITAINGETFIFRTTKKITGATLTYFVTQDKSAEIDFAKMKQGDRVYNGDIEYTIKSILRTSEGVLLDAVLSYTESVENYRAQSCDHIARITKKFS